MSLAGDDRTHMSTLLVDATLSGTLVYTLSGTYELSSNSFIGILWLEIGDHIGLLDTNSASDASLAMVQAAGHTHSLASLCVHCYRVYAPGDIASSTCPYCRPSKRRTRVDSGFASPSARTSRARRYSTAAIHAINECIVLDAARAIVAVPHRLTNDLTIAGGTRTYCITVCADVWSCSCGAMKDSCTTKDHRTLYHCTRPASTT